MAKSLKFDTTNVVVQSYGRFVVIASSFEINVMYVNDNILYELLMWQSILKMMK
jgi:hypothetical protein